MDNEKRSYLVNKGLEYQQSGDCVKAFECFSEAISLSPEKGLGTSWIYAMSATTAIQAQSSETLPIMLCEKGIKADPTYDMNYEILGKIYIALGETEKGSHYLKQAEILSQNQD